MRTTQEILGEMDTMQSALPEAAGLTSKSRVSVFGTMRNLWALFVQGLEHQVDTSLADADAAIKKLQIGSLAWYADQARAFQFGDALTVVDGRPAYPTVDLTKRIVTQAAVVEGSVSQLTMKVAKPDGIYTQKLSAAELDAFTAYIGAIKFAGVKINIVSLPPDELKVVATVFVDRQYINLSGGLVANPDIRPVDAALIEYGRQLPVNSVIFDEDIVDFLQKTPGVLRFNVTQLFIRPAGAVNWTEFGPSALSAAGHVKVTNFQISYT